MTTDHPGQPDVHIQRFNESFYRSDPADYLLTRFQLLMLAGSRQSELARLLAKGVEFGGMTIGPTESATDDEMLPVDDCLDPFLTIESQQLLHHASETVLRLFIVHGTQAAVPWVEMSSQRSPKEFKEQICLEFVENSPSPDLIGYVCLGNSRCPPEKVSSDWDGAIDGITAFLRTFAVHILEEANLYNAIKHGLGVTAGDAVATIGGQQLGFGTSVEYPESDTWNEGSRPWSLTTRWIDLTQSLGLTTVAIEMIGSIWKLGRYRHLGGTAAGNLFFPVTLRPNDLQGPNRPPMQRMSWKLLTEVQNPHPESNPRSQR